MDLSSSPRALAISSIHPTVAVATDDALLVFEGNLFEKRRVITLASARSLTFSCDGNYLAFGTSSGVLTLLLCDNYTTASSARHHSADIRALSFSPQSTRLVSGGDDKGIMILSVPALTVLHAIPNQPNIIRSVIFLNNHSFISCGDSIIRFRDIDSGKCMFAVKEHTGKILSIVLSPNGKVIASGGSDKKLKIFRTIDRVIVGSFDFANYVQRVCFIDDSTLVAGVYQSDMVMINIDTGLIIRKLGKYKEPNGIVTRQRQVFVEHFGPKIAAKSEISCNLPIALPLADNWMADLSLNTPISAFLEYLQLPEVRFLLICCCIRL